MAQLITHRWDPDPTFGLAQRDRTGCEYEAYVPDPVWRSTVRAQAGTAAKVAGAEREIARLNAEAKALGDSEAIARLLLRAARVGR